MRNKRKIFLTLISSLCLFWGFHENRKVKVWVRPSHGQDFVISMPVKDRKHLDYFFKDLLIEDCGGYTLFGNKPMFMGGYTKPFCLLTWHRFLRSLFPPNLRVCRGWKTWKKYQHFFSDSAFLLVAEPNPLFLRWEKPTFREELNPVVSILLINKEKFCETVTAYQKDFQTILEREDLSCNQLLLEAETLPFLKTVLQCKEELFGILLGYGRENARLFQEREDGKEVAFFAFPWGEEVEYFFRHRLGDMWWWFGIYPKQLELFLGYPTFLVDPDSLETKRLKEEFLETRKRILTYYEGKDFLEATLSRLASP